MPECFACKIVLAGVLKAPTDGSATGTGQLRKLQFGLCYLLISDLYLNYLLNIILARKTCQDRQSTG